MARRFQFVSASKPTEHVSSESRKLNHSHVMRHVHAKKRRLRTQRYQDELINVGMEQDLMTSETVLSSPPVQRFADSRDPFSSLARPLSSEEYFLLDHCMCIDALPDYPGLISPFLVWADSPISPNLPNHMTYPLRSNMPDLIVDIQVVVPYTIGHCDLFDGDGDHRKQMLREWVGLAVTDDTFMTVAILLSTCRYMLLYQPGEPLFTRMALRYKQICLHSLRLEIESKPSSVNVMSVAKALALAVDEVRLLLSAWFACAV